MTEAAKKSLFVRMFSGAVLDQALLSAASLAVGLVLVRHTTELQYAYYVLVTNGILLLTSLQNAFVGPAMVSRMTMADAAGRVSVIGGIYRERGHVLLALTLLYVLGVLAAWALGKIDGLSCVLMLTAAVAAFCAMQREYFRIVLTCYQMPGKVLRADIPYAVLLIAGAGIAITSPWPATAANLSLAVAAIVGVLLLRRSVRAHEGWTDTGSPGILRQIAPLAAWSAAGAAIHWTFSQGYSYLVAATLDVTAVAAIAATRLLMMPVNLLSTGIGSMMLPLATRWLQHHGAGRVLARLSCFSLAIAGAALCWFSAMWWARDWLFDDVLNKSFAERDALLLWWSAIFLVMAVRDQIVYLLVARQRFRPMTVLTLSSAMISAACSYYGMHQLGQVGALVGMLIGESFHFTGVVLMCLRERGRSNDLHVMTGAQQATPTRT